MEKEIEEMKYKLRGGEVRHNGAGWVCEFCIVPLIKMVVKTIREIEKKLDGIEISIKKQAHSPCCYNGDCWDDYVLAVIKELEFGKEVVCQTRMGLSMTLKGRATKELSSMGKTVEEYREFVKKILED